MRLKSFPVAFKLYEDRQAISEIPFIRRMNHKSTLFRRHTEQKQKI